MNKELFTYAYIRIYWKFVRNHVLMISKLEQYIKKWKK